MRPTSSHHHDTFVAWMTDHRGIVTKVVRGFTRSPDDFEDLRQEVELAIWRSVPSFRGESKPSTWIWRVALNRALSWGQKREPFHETLEHTAEPTDSKQPDEQLLLEHIYGAIRRLRPIDRSLVLLSLEGHPYREIASITGLSESNVGARLSRARAKLAAQIQETS